MAAIWEGDDWKDPATWGTSDEEWQESGWKAAWGDNEGGEEEVDFGGVWGEFTEDGEGNLGHGLLLVSIINVYLTS